MTSSYTATIAAHILRAVSIARGRGLEVKLQPPFLKLRRRRSSACLIVHPTHLVLEALEVQPRDRRKRYGSALLDDVITIAEGLGLQIDLIAESATHRNEPGLIQSKLESWYRRHAFVGAGGGDRLMRRLPNLRYRSRP